MHVRGVPHYMIDVAGPKDEYSVSDYRDTALPIAEDLVSQGKVPVICGGTGFYINSPARGAVSRGNCGFDLLAIARGICYNMYP